MLCSAGSLLSAARLLMFCRPVRSALMMVGMVFSSVMRPAAATAPAPMGRM